MTERYGFLGEDWENETVSDLAEDLNRDTHEHSYRSDSGSFQPISMDYYDPTFYNEQPPLSSVSTTVSGTLVRGGEGEESVSDTLRRGLEDPLLREEMIRMITQKKGVCCMIYCCLTSLSLDIEQQAREWDPDAVSNFLQSINLHQHCQMFLEEEITGPQLLSADREVYNELGVSSNIECARIAVLFKREVSGETTPLHSLGQLLSSNPKLVNYEAIMADKETDADMLVYAHQNGFLKELLTELGITKALDRNRIESIIREIPMSPPSPHSEGSSVYVAYSTPV